MGGSEASKEQYLEQNLCFLAPGTSKLRVVLVYFITLPAEEAAPLPARPASPGDHLGSEPHPAGYYSALASTDPLRNVPLAHPGALSGWGLVTVAVRVA